MTLQILADRNIPFVEQCFSSIGTVRSMAGRDMTAQALRDVDILLVRSVTTVGPALLGSGRVRFIGSATIGTDHIDMDFLRDRGIRFAAAPGSNADSAAEYIIAGLLDVAQRRRIVLAGRSIGVVGAGNVGRGVARRAAAIGMEVVLNDPPLRQKTGDSVYQPIDRIFDCDFVTLHTPLTFTGPHRTAGLAGEEFFQSLKAGCVFFNASRGAVVRTGSLKRAVASGRLGGAVIDVWENEPDIDTELVEIVDIATPHIAGYSLDGKIAGMIMIYKAACDFLGVQPQFQSRDFFPDPDMPQLVLDPAGSDIQSLVISAVRGVYDVRRDDKNMRGILTEKPQHRGGFFETLRRDYPVRREFSNTEVIFNKPSSDLKKIFSGLGFGVRP